MYRKRLTNLTLKQSKYMAVKKKQEAHFYRACRRVFHMKEHNSNDLLRHRLQTAQRYRFLFLNSQYINKPVKHLMYNHGLVSEEYGFPTPHYYKIADTASRADGHLIRSKRVGLSSQFPDVGQPWVRNYNPYSDVYVPDR